MDAAGMPYEVRQRGDHVEVRGASLDDVQAGLLMLDEVRADEATAVRDALVKVLVAHGITRVPPASLAQAERLAGHRSALLEQGSYSSEELGALLGYDKAQSTRAWLTRRRARDEVFTVKHDGRTVIPAFQLTSDGETRPELQPVLAALDAAGVDGWARWTWLTTPTPWLSGEIPEQLAGRDPERVLHATRRFVAGFPGPHQAGARTAATRSA